MSHLELGLDYGKEAHRSRVFGKFGGNMVGYKMGSSLVGVYTTVESFVVESFKRG